MAKRKVPLGTIKPWSDKTITRLSKISPEDIEKAKAEVIPELKILLDADEKEVKALA